MNDPVKTNIKLPRFMRFFLRQACCEEVSLLEEEKADIEHAIKSEDEKLHEIMQQIKSGIQITDDDAINYINRKSGFERVKDMYSKDESGNLPEEFWYPAMISGTCATMAYLIGGMRGGMRAQAEFKEKHLHTKWPTKLLAARKMNDTIFLGSIFGGLKFALKLGGFATIFMFTAETLSVYNNKNSWWHYSAAGACAGGTFRLNMGLRGLVAGSLVGSVLGTLGGGLMYGMHVATNQTRQICSLERAKHQLLEDRFLAVQMSYLNAKQQQLQAAAERKGDETEQKKQDNT